MSGLRTYFCIKALDVAGCCEGQPWQIEGFARSSKFEQEEGSNAEAVSAPVEGEEKPRRWAQAAQKDDRGSAREG